MSYQDELKAQIVSLAKQVALLKAKMQTVEISMPIVLAQLSEFCCHASNSQITNDDFLQQIGSIPDRENIWEKVSDFLDASGLDGDDGLYPKEAYLATMENTWREFIKNAKLLTPKR